MYEKTDKISIKDTLINDIDFVLVTKGNYTFGIDDEIKNITYNYWIMKYEVTNLQYCIFLNEALKLKSIFIDNDTVTCIYNGDKIRPKGNYHALVLDGHIKFRNNIFEVDKGFDTHPATCLTWFGCNLFCEYYGFQIPSKYEWEKAARGNTGWNYPWGDVLDSRRANFHNSGDPFDNETTPVGFYNGQTYNVYQTINSPSPYGCYDMAGNAWEVTNSTIYPDKGFIEGGGGGYLYHTGAMTQTWFRSRFGFPIPSRIDRSFVSDGLRCIIKIKE